MSDSPDDIANNLLAEARRLIDFASTIADEFERGLVYQAAHDLISEAALVLAAG